jgi:hypothetical protein
MMTAHGNASFFSDPVVNGTIVVIFFRCGSATVTSKPDTVKEITTDATKRWQLELLKQSFKN